MSAFARPGLLALAGIALTFWACGGGSGGGSGGRGGVSAGTGGSSGAGGAALPASSIPQEANYRPCLPFTQAGRFALELQADSEITTFVGAVKSGPDPTSSLQEVKTAGACRLLKPQIRSCTPACAAGTYCSPSRTCVAPPENQDVGDVNVSGLAQAVAISRSNQSKLYSNDGVIPYPGVAEGANVKLTSSGGSYAPLALEVKGVAPLKMISPEPVVKRGTALRLDWQAPAQQSGARVHVLLSIDNHGTSKQQLECDAPDTGTLEIAASLIDAALDLGFSGLPTLTLARRSVESVNAAPGCVEFNVLAKSVVEVDIEGLTSCKAQEDCPTGTTCDTTKQLCQ